MNYKRRFTLNGAAVSLPSGRGLPALGDVDEVGGRTLDGQQRHLLQAGLGHLGLQLGRPVDETAERALGHRIHPAGRDKRVDQRPEAGVTLAETQPQCASMIAAQREIATASTTPPGAMIRRASRSSCIRPSRSCRW